MRVKSKSYHHGDLRSAVELIAWDAVHTEGAEKLSLRACARAANVDPAAVYRHFKSKDDILAALTARAFRELSEAMQANQSALAGSCAKDALMAIGLTYVDYATRNPNIFAMMFDVAGRMSMDRIAQDMHDGENAYTLLQNALHRWLPSLDESGLEIVAFALWSNVHGLSKLFNSGFGPLKEAERKKRARQVCAVTLDGCQSVLMDAS